MNTPFDNQIKILCRRIKKADKNAASELLKIYYADIYSYLRRLCGSKQDAEDLTQQTFLRLWSTLNGFAGRSRFSTWLYRIAHNTYIDWQRKNIRRNLSNVDRWWQDSVNTNPGPFTNAAERQLAEQIYEAVDQLDGDKRQVVHLHYYQELSITETAEILNVATSTVKYKLREVLKILKQKLNVEEKELK